MGKYKGNTSYLLSITPEGSMKELPVFKSDGEALRELAIGELYYNSRRKSTMTVISQQQVGYHHDELGVPKLSVERIAQLEKKKRMREKELDLREEVKGTLSFFHEFGDPVIDWCSWMIDADKEGYIELADKLMMKILELDERH